MKVKLTELGYANLRGGIAIVADGTGVITITEIDGGVWSEDSTFVGKQLFDGEGWNILEGTIAEACKAGYLELTPNE